MDDTDSGDQAARASLHGETARIPWRELQRFFAGGVTVAVAPELDLVEVAVQLGLDNTTRFQQWIDGGGVTSVSDTQALAWYEEEAELWAVVAAPWVLVQDRPAGKSEVPA